MARLAGNVSPRDLTAALDEVSRRSSPPAQVVATPIAASDSPRLHENARPSRRGGRARLPHRVCQSCGAAARAIHRSPAGAGGEDGSRRAPVRDRTAIGAGGRDARRHRNRGWRAARVVAHTSRGPSGPGAIRRSGEPRGGGELARDWCRGDGRGRLCGTLWTATGLCRVTKQCGRRAGSRRHAGSA